MRVLLKIAVLAALAAPAAAAQSADQPTGGPVIKTSEARPHATARCDAGRCVKPADGLSPAAFTLSSIPKSGTRIVHAAIYAGVCDAATPSERIVRIEERRRRTSVELLVLLRDLPKPDPATPPVICPAIARAYPFEIRLSARLGHRSVRDASTVPARKPPRIPGIHD